MNKQELIEKIAKAIKDELSGNYYREFDNYGHIEYEHYKEEDAQSVANDIILDLEEDLEQLDEPQNPVVPCSVGSLIEFYREKGVTLKHILNCFNEWADTDNEHTDEVNWIVSNPETFMRAWLDGYEVEKEPSWIVKRLDGTIVTQFALWGQDGKYRGIDTDHPKPLIFTNKEKADAVALLLDGEVVEG